MMQTMNLGQFIARVAGAAMAVKAAENAALTRAAKVVEAEAKREIGTYQGAVGPFPAWAPLAESTQADRVREGFPADEPLLRTGEMRASIGHAVKGNVAVIGSNSDKAVWQELGTKTIPPRSFLGGALMRKLPEVRKELASGALGALVGPGVAKRLTQG